MPCAPALTLALLALAPEGFAHVRLATPAGTVHVLHPVDRSAIARTVLYVHGYRDDADSAWRDHRLSEQFAASRRDALFIAPEAPAGPGEGVAWPELASLLDAVERALGLAVPRSCVVAVGHSGAFRTLRLWAPSRALTHLVLLDGFYGDPAPWRGFLERRGGGASLWIVGRVTGGSTEAWLRSLPVRLRERVDYRRARETHLEIVTSGRWIPRLLRELAFAPGAEA